MYCQNCGKEIETGVSFCPNCGSPVNNKPTAKKKKKKGIGCLTFLCIIIILAAVLIVSSIGSEPSDQAIDAAPNANDTSNAQMSEAKTVDNTDAANSDSITIGTEENISDIIVDNEAFTATFIKAQDEPTLGVFYIFINVENKTDSEIVINLDDADVDGETIPLITTGIPLVIRPGNSGQTGFIFSMVNLSIDTMEDAKDATFRVVARDNETFSVIAESDLVTVALH